MRRITLTFLISILFFASGCGYTTKSLLPSDIKTIYVDNFANGIKITAEQSNVRMYRGYTPGMERTLTTAVIDKFLTDGTLKIVSENDADLVLTGELVDFGHDVLRYDANNNVEEYRVRIVVNMALEDRKKGKVLWSEKNFAGESTYYTQGSQSQSENAAIDNAMTDIARRIVERTVEVW